MIINGTTYRVLKGFRPLVKTSIKWNKKSNGRWAGNDFGQSNDTHETTITLLGSFSLLGGLLSFLRDNTESISITLDDGETIFGPHISSGTMNILVIKYGTLKKVSTADVYEVDLTIRLLSHTDHYITNDVDADDFTSELLGSLTHVEGFTEQDRSWEMSKYDSYTGLFTVNEDGFTEGVLKFTVRIFENGAGSNVAGKLIKGLLTRVRNNDFLFPTNPFFSVLWSINNPFGPDSAGPWVVKVNSWKIRSKENPNYWDIDFQMSEV
jgi:hypothetical protein